MSGTVWQRPKATPTDIVAKLNAASQRLPRRTKDEKRFAEVGGIAIGGTPAEYGKLIADETEKWGKVVKAANLKAE